MSVNTTIAVPTPKRRTWPVVSAAAFLAVAALVAVLAVTLSRGGSGSTGSTARPAATPQPTQYGSDAMASIMKLTPARLAAGALGLGYALPSTQTGPTVASVLASMDPQTRQYTQKVMSLTFAQLAAGAAGAP